MILDTMEKVSAFIADHDKAIILCKSHDCSVCLSIEARMDKEAEVYKDWAIARVYVDDLELFRGQHTVFTVPTILMFYEQKEIYRTSRFIEFDRLAYFVNAID